MNWSRRMTWVMTGTSVSKALLESIPNEPIYIWIVGFFVFLSLTRVEVFDTYIYMYRNSKLDFDEFADRVRKPLK